MKISVITLFPQMFAGPFNYSILKNAQEKKLVEIELINLRDFGIGSHKMVDDKPYGGGIGMVIKVDVLEKAIAQVKEKNKQFNNQKIFITDPRGELLTQQKVQQLTKIDHLILVCGHYEGIDERIYQFIDGAISIGSYVLTGGEIPVMVIVDAVSRLIPSVLPPGATDDESFSQSLNKLLEYPHYTRPPIYKNLKVPDILLSGNHAQIKKWREHQAQKITKNKHNN